MIVVRPVPIGTGKLNSKAGQFEAWVGERMLLVSREPFLAAARVLLGDGVDPATPLHMRHFGNTKVAMTSTVGKAAGLRVKEGEGPPRLVPWRVPPQAGTSAGELHPCVQRETPLSDIGADTKRTSDAPARL